ncbi:Sulfur transfer protein involved in thiamine biosynthesis [Methylacidimicrobium sp. AP8]|uniref:sulfur carrier protein ThiS n=1 Tax=Methylacidimicrobium sp. AP8 TaxID=2730359 RepID=UPI0018C172FA|nr:sulfur carrier protein ThiS [Methylacidimicrobium sp. AP8]CAB4242644.1 Sulfur transfer protein involved in thiamine biosynthesis [Methylacidimicrobium sp. AP8]
MPDECRIHVNGKEATVPAGTSVSDLLVSLGYPAKIVLVELNKEVLPRREWSVRRLQPEDRVEVLRVVAGG